MFSQASVCPWGEGVQPLVENAIYGQAATPLAGGLPLGRHHLEAPIPGKTPLGRNPQADIPQASTLYADIPLPAMTPHPGKHLQADTPRQQISPGGHPSRQIPIDRHTPRQTPIESANSI